MLRKRDASSQEDEGMEAENLMNLEGAKEINQDADEPMDGVEYTEEGETSSEPSFLDTFYGLSSESNIERSQAAQTMLSHCLVGPSANLKDAAYAFRRLLNGLCSGRAAARQGYASALTSFLKCSYQMGVLNSINPAGDESSTLSYVRDQLVKMTDPKDTDCTKYGKRKGSEERDHHFGRLFGILSVVRSGILLPKKGQSDLNQIKSVSSGFVRDIIGLYNHRKWMREPSAYAIVNLLDSFYLLCPQQEASEVVKFLVSDVVTPEFLSCATLQDFTAEQIAVALNIQAQSKQYDLALPPKLRSALLSKQTVPDLAKALSSTSVVSQPRAHVVWDIIWCPFLTAPVKQSGKASKNKPHKRTLKERLPQCKDTALDVVKSIVEHVIMGSLLGLEQEAKHNSGVNATHGRRALALSLVEVLCGCETFSPNAGPFQIQLDDGILETSILTPAIIQKLFLDVISARGGQYGGPLLKPMSLKVLNSIVDSSNLSPDEFGRRLACAKAILSCDPRFDCRTKSASCSSLLFLENNQIEAISPGIVELWEQYVDFLIGKILLAASKAARSNESAASYEALGYVDLIYTLAKRIFRFSPKNKHGAIDNMRQKVLSFFFVGAHFDCSEIRTDKQHGLLEVAREISIGLESVPSVLPYEIRVVMSARFYSLLVDFAATSQFIRDSSPEEVDKPAKDLSVLKLLMNFSNGYQKLESHGCKRLVSTTDEEDELVTGIVSKQQEAATSVNNESSGVLQRFRVGCAILSSILHLHLLRCGQANEMSESENMDLDDDEEDNSEVREFISDLASAQHSLMVAVGIAEKEVDDDESEEDENALVLFAHVCGGILSSNLNECGQTGGATPKLLREAVKTAWSGALKLCLEHKSTSLFDKSLQTILLELIGVDLENLQDEDEEEVSDAESDDNESNDSSDGSAGIFAKAASSGLDIEDSDKVSPDEMGEDLDMATEEDNGDEDVELNDTQLQTMLMEDDDEDDNSQELEHHAGADKALAKLIKLKKDARKAGQQARERIVLLNQLRCVLLLDISLRQIADHKCASEFVLGMILPMLQRRRTLEKAVMAGRAGQKPGPNDNEKRGMVEKLTSLMKSKLFKIKKLPEIEEEEFSQLALGVVNETRKDGSDGHFQCCSSGLILLCRSSASTNSITSLRSTFGDLVNEWATKRTSKVKTIFFENLVQQDLSFAKILLTKPLCQASKDARSSFLKSECFRLLTLFWCGDETKKESHLSEMGDEVVRENCSVFAVSLLEAMKDADMRKTKRIRDLLKSADKFIECIQNKTVDERNLINTLGSLSSEICSLKDTTESSGVKSVCEKLCPKIDDFISQSQSRLDKTEKTSSENPPSSKKKKKKKKGKRN